MRMLPRRGFRSQVVFVAVVVLTSLLATNIALAQIPASKWVQVNSSNKPSARLGCVMVFDPISQKTIMFGGYDGNTWVNDTWSFDGTNWTLITTATAPPGRAAGSAAYDSKLKQVVLFGGFNGQYLNDTWLWDGATSTWMQATPAHVPTAVTGPMLFPDPRTGSVDEFGGFDGRFYQLMNWRWKNGDWHPIKGKQFPSARGSAVFGTDPVSKQTVVFGGLADVNPVNTWTFDGRTWTQQSLLVQPSERLNTGAAYDPRFSGVVVFGGFAGQDINETWLWSANAWTQLSPQKSPPPRESMGMAFDELHQQSVVFGGLKGKSLLNDTWVLQTK